MSLAALARRRRLIPAPFCRIVDLRVPDLEGESFAPEDEIELIEDIAAHFEVRG